MELTLAEELLLVAHRSDGKRLAGWSELDRGIAGAIIADLVFARRLGLTDGRVVIRSPQPTADRDLNDVMTRIGEIGKRRKPQWWIEKLSGRKLRQMMLDRLVHRGLLARQSHQVLGIFPGVRYVKRNRHFEDPLWTRLSNVVERGSRPDDRTGALVALIHACGLARKLFPNVDRRVLKIRMKEVSDGEWAAEAVRDAIRSASAVQAAITSSTAGAGG